MDLPFSRQHLEACTYMKKKRWPSGFKGLFLHCSNVPGTTVMLGLEERRRKVHAMVILTPISPVTHYPNLTALTTRAASTWKPRAMHGTHLTHRKPALIPELSFPFCCSRTGWIWVTNWEAEAAEGCPGPAAWWLCWLHPTCFTSPQRPQAGSISVLFQELPHFALTTLQI